MTSASERRPIVFGVDALAPGPTALAWVAAEAGPLGLPPRLVHTQSTGLLHRVHCPVVTVPRRRS